MLQMASDALCCEKRLGSAGEEHWQTDRILNFYQSYDNRQFIFFRQPIFKHVRQQLLKLNTNKQQSVQNGTNLSPSTLIRRAKCASKKSRRLILNESHHPFLFGYL